MRIRSAFVLVSIVAVGAAIGCSSSSSTPVAPIRGASSTAPSSAPSAAPTVGASATPLRTTPPSATPVPTPTPTAAPTEGQVGNITCTATPIAVPGAYMSIETTGNVVGNTYSGDAEEPGVFEVDEYTAATPTPIASATPVSSPTPVETLGPTPTPGPTATPVMVTLYYGEYDYQNFAGREIPSPGATYTTSPNDTGCFEMELVQAVGGTAGQSHPRRQRAGLHPLQDEGADNAFGFGEPNEGTGDFNVTEIDFGNLDGIDIQNLTASTGNGVFEFHTAVDQDIEGTITITGSQTLTTSDFLKQRARIRRSPFMNLRR